MSEPIEYEASHASFALTQNRQVAVYMFATDKGPIVVSLHRDLFRNLFLQTKNELALESPRAPELKGV